MTWQNLRILVTRPEPQGKELCEKIKIKGGKAIYFPVIDILPPDDEKLFQQQIAKLDQFDWLIFISPQAVKHSVATIKTCWSSFPPHVKIACIGESTATALQENGFPKVTFPEEDWRTEGFLELPEFQHVTHQKIAILCGQEGRELLAETLKARGASVTNIVAYQRKLPKVAISEYIHIIEKDSFDIIVSTSQKSLQNLLLLIEKDYWQALFHATLIVISERIAALAQEMGFKKIVIAKNASHEQILIAIEAIDKRNVYGK